MSGAGKHCRSRKALDLYVQIVFAGEFIFLIRRLKNIAGHCHMKSSNTMGLRAGTFLFVIAVVIVSGILWWNDGVAAVDALDKTSVEFSVKPGDGVRVIATNLSDKNLIRSATAFFIVVKLLGFETNLQAGEFRLNRSMNARVIAEELTHGIADSWITTLEGWRVEEVAAKIAKDLEIPESEFLKVAKEGYMFPDTYMIPKDATVGAIVKVFTDTFDEKVTETMRLEAQKNGVTFDEAMILASIVEREGRTDEDRPIISGILLNRLKNDWPLQADATLQYALGYQTKEKSWWRKELFDEDKEVRSPYNTYINKGLPPAPICNPGLSAIKAALYPKVTEYMYYIHDDKGIAHYAKTLEEHNANVSQYLR